MSELKPTPAQTKSAKYRAARLVERHGLNEAKRRASQNLADADTKQGVVVWSIACNILKEMAQ